MIEVSNLTKRYAGRTAVSDISFSVARGEIVGLLGPNGAGKSTTMRILSGFMPGTSGTVPMTNDTVFRIASMTKAITSTAALQLVDQGKMALDEPASKHLPMLATLNVLEGFDAAGKPSFNALQNRAQQKSEREIAAADAATPVIFYCFDLLHFAGVDLRGKVYRDRRRYLSQCLLPSPSVQLVVVQNSCRVVSLPARVSSKTVPHPVLVLPIQVGDPL